MRRQVHCLDRLSNAYSDECNEKDMPDSVKECNAIIECPITTTTTEGNLSLSWNSIIPLLWNFFNLFNQLEPECNDTLKFSICSKINLSNRCFNPYLYSKCCKTCTIPAHTLIKQIAYKDHF